MIRTETLRRFVHYVAANPATRPNIVRVESSSEWADVLPTFDLNDFRLLAVRQPTNESVEMIVRRVRTVSLTTLRDAEGDYRIAVNGRPADAARSPKLIDLQAADSLADLARLLCSVRVVRAARLLGYRDTVVPFALGIGLTGAPKRLRRTRAFAVGDRLLLRGWERPLLVSLRIACEPWTIADIRSIRSTDFSQKGVIR